MYAVYLFASTMRRTLVGISLLALSLAPAAAFERRLVKLGGRPGTEEVREHVSFSLEQGFEGFFVYSAQAGLWSARSAPDGPFLFDDFRELARLCRERNARLTVSINPVADSGGDFVFSERAGERRIARFVELLRREGVDSFVLSFDDQPTRLTELRDVVRYGTVAAPAHLDLVRRLARRFRRGERLWLCASAYSDAQLGDGTTPYAAAFLRGLPALPSRIGIVWTGPAPISPSITADDLEKARRRLGGRDLLLYDNYPTVEDPGISLALVLGPLRNRDPRLGDVARVYLSCPTNHLGGDRLTLRTIASWLKDPAGYDPDAAWRAARDAVAGSDRKARAALDVQASEWGGWIGTRNGRRAETDDPSRVALRLDDAAFVASFEWVVARYPDRMKDLSGLADVPFRDALLAAMARRLAVARALPLVLEFRARAKAGREDASRVVEALRAMGDDPAADDDTRRTLRSFLRAAGVPP